MMFDFSDQVIIVTGATGNLGSAVVRAFHAAGAHIVAPDRSTGRARELFPELAGSKDHILADGVDVTDPEQVGRLVQETLDRFERIDVLVNTVGGFRAGPSVHETPLEAWDFLFNLNARSVFIASRAVVPAMLRQGRGKIVNIASLGGLLAWPGYIPYAVSKAGLIHLTRCLARALGPEIQVNCVCPGSIQFPGDAPDESYIRKAALGRTGEANDIAQAVLFLLTQEFITGQALVVDGGYALA